MRKASSRCCREAERRAYHDVGANRASVAKEIERLTNCEGLVFVFPTWWYGMPAILKGYIDRVWVPGVAFTLARRQDAAAAAQHHALRAW